MWTRLLLAIDQFEEGQVALDFVAGLARSNDAEVTVLHVRELSSQARVPPLETPADAQLLVDRAVRHLDAAGIPAVGRLCAAREGGVARGSWRCPGPRAARPSSWAPAGSGGSAACPGGASGSTCSGCRRCRW